MRQKIGTVVLVRHPKNEVGGLDPETGPGPGRHGPRGCGDGGRNALLGGRTVLLRALTEGTVLIRLCREGGRAKCWIGV